MILKVGTRGSKLAVIQTDIVLKMLEKVALNLRFQKVTITTTGDKDQRPFRTYILKGVFEKEIDTELMKGKIDFAVHSLKDIPVNGYDELVIAAVTKRDSPNDVLVSNNGSKLLELKSGNVVGTSSPRRMIQIKYARPDLKIKQLRGNIETRIDKVRRDEYDAIVLAKAGLNRLGMGSLVSETLPLETFTPAPGQGALAVVARRDDESMLQLLSKIDDFRSRNEVMLERYIATRLGGGCQAPIGVIARQKGDHIYVYISLFSLDGRKKVACKAEGEIDDITVVANEAVRNLLGMGVANIIGEWRIKSVSW